MFLALWAAIKTRGESSVPLPFLVSSKTKAFALDSCNFYWWAWLIALACFITSPSCSVPALELCRWRGETGGNAERQLRTSASSFGWRRKAGDGSGAFLSGPHSVPLCEKLCHQYLLITRMYGKMLYADVRGAWEERKRGFSSSVGNAWYLLWACHSVSLGGLFLSSYEQKIKLLSSMQL